jgi:hypothetical protein
VEAEEVQEEWEKTGEEGATRGKWISKVYRHKQGISTNGAMVKPLSEAELAGKRWRPEREREREPVRKPQPASQSQSQRRRKRKRKRRRKGKQERRGYSSLIHS